MKSYGDGIYYNDQAECVPNDTCNKENAQATSNFPRAVNSSCVTCQKRLREEHDRSSCFQPPSISFEDQDSSLSMLLWDQNHHKSICHTYDSIPTSNESKQNLGMVFDISAFYIGSYLLFYLWFEKIYSSLHNSFGTGMYNCYRCNQVGESDLNSYGHNSQSQALSCCEQSGQMFGFNRNYHRNGLSNTQVYGTIGNGKNEIE